MVWSGLVMVTFPAPRVADVEIVIVAVSGVALTNTVELTVIPAAEKAVGSRAGLELVPVIVTC